MYMYTFVYSSSLKIDNPDKADDIKAIAYVSH